MTKAAKNTDKDKIAKIDSQMEAAEARRNELFKQKEPIDAELGKLYNKLKDLRTKKNDLVLKNMGEKADWDFLLAVDNAGHGVGYNVLYEEFKKIGLSYGGSYHPSTNQVSVNISLDYRNKEQITKAVNGLREVVPSLKTDGNVKTIGISEHTCARFGVYTLVLAKEGEHCKITKLAYSRQSDVKNFNTWKEALTYISEQLWYGKGPSEEEY